MTEGIGRAGLVLLAGELVDFPIRAADWDIIVAADGGALHALKQGVHPDRIIGDMDSLPSEELQPFLKAGVRVERLPTDKDLTDGEAALQAVISEGVDTIVLAGGLGGRFDHSLGNVMLLWQVHVAGRFGWVTDGRQRVYLLSDTLQIEGSPGDQLSIIPLTASVDGVTVSGVRWPLHNRTLHFGSSLSLSNELLTAKVSLSLKNGRALVAVSPRGT